MGAASDAVSARERSFILAVTNNPTALIANGASLSGEVDLAGNRPLALIMPVAWTAAVITFQGSHDGGTTYQNVYDSDGNELTSQAAASRNIGLTTNAAWVLGQFGKIKVRSGTSGAVVNQSPGAAGTTITIVTGTA